MSWLPTQWRQQLVVASTQRQYICMPTAHGFITIQMFQDQNSCDSLILKNPSVNGSISQFKYSYSNHRQWNKCRLSSDRPAVVARLSTTTSSFASFTLVQFWLKSAVVPVDQEELAGQRFQRVAEWLRNWLNRQSEKNVVIKEE